MIPSPAPWGGGVGGKPRASGDDPDPLDSDASADA